MSDTVHTADGAPLTLTPREAQAFRDIVEAYIAFEDDCDAQPSLPEVIRLRIPRADGGPVTHQINCRAATLAHQGNDPAPLCTWQRDMTAGGYRCTLCATWVGPETWRHDTMAEMFGDPPEGHKKIDDATE